MKQIASYKVLVCAGTGGVGKTSISAAMGMAAAEAGKRVLVLTIDPAKRLKTALGLNDLGINDTVPVKLPDGAKGKLDAGVVNAKLVFDQFVEKASPDQESAKLLLNNLLYQKLSLGLQGSQEFTSLERFYTAFESDQYDLIIVDTPPSQHAIDFLEGPKRLHRLFDESVLKWFISEKESKFGLVNKVIRTGTRKAFSLLEKLTGKQFVDEIFNFFVSMKLIRKSLVERMKQIDQLLHSSDVAFILVTAYDAKKIGQAMDFHHRLEESGFQFGGLVINRCFPTEEMLSVDQAEISKRLYYNEVKNYFQEEEKAFDSISAQMSGGTAKLRVFEQLGESDPVKLIRGMSQQLKWSNDG